MGRAGLRSGTLYIGFQGLGVEVSGLRKDLLTP